MTSEIKLHELPPDDPRRNTFLKELNVRIRCRHTQATRDPRTWKIKNNTYNHLDATWQNNFDFLVL